MLQNTSRFVGKWHDLLLGVASTVIVFIGGCYLAFTYNAVWLNRAGALIIIIGVILTVNRIHEIFENRLINLFDENGENEVVKILEKKLDRPLLPSEHSYFKEVAQDELVNTLKSITLERKQVFRYFEVWLIIFGTFLNGFGDYLVSLIKTGGI